MWDYQGLSLKKGLGTPCMAWAAGIASLFGPACAVLFYTISISDIPISDLAFVWLLATLGAIGIGIGIVAFRKGSKVAGTICVLTNIPALAYFGFIASFVSMGGHR